MSLRITLAVAARVLTQLRRDHRTLAMLLVLPCLVIALLWWMFTDLPGRGFDALAPALLALIPFIVMFLVTSVTTLRERTSGTLERLLAMPLGKGDFLLGYALAFGLVAAAQSALAVTVATVFLDLSLEGPVWMLLVVAVLDAILGSALGLFVSAFARTEFQAVQFMPALVFPQILLCGLFVDRDLLPSFLDGVSRALPLTYAVDAMSSVADHAHPSIAADLLVIVAFTAAALVLGALTLRRQTD
ncbi:MAG: ABC transporter permease [Nocardioidaceae bacterium]|nr:ABC transporter permease [Nocardioidaceae bacterium]